jgi:hypothetical protein
MNVTNMRWLGDLCGEQGGVFKTGEGFQPPDTEHPICASQAWSYEPATQTAIVQTVWEEMDTDGRVLDRIERNPIRLHVLFRFEMEHLLARVGFEIVAVFGDFFRGKLLDESSDMIWVARVP